jgi:putative flippase GtrA
MPCFAFICRPAYKEPVSPFRLRFPSAKQKRGKTPVVRAFAMLGSGQSSSDSMRALLKQIVSFGLIGFINAGIDTAVFFAALKLVTDNLIVANVCAWIVAVTCSYALNSRFTFKKPFRLKDYLFFATTQIGGLVANTTALVLTAPLVPLIVAKIIAIGFGFIVNFTLARFIVFRAPK